MEKFIRVYGDYYGKPDVHNQFWVNPIYIIKVGSKTITEHKRGTEFETVENTYYWGIINLGTFTEVIYFLYKEDYYNLTKGIK